MAMVDSQPISQEVSMLQTHNYQIQPTNVARNYIQSQQRMKQLLNLLGQLQIKSIHVINHHQRSEKLKLELLTQFEINNPSSRRSTSVPPQKYNQRPVQQNYQSSRNPSSNQVSPKCVNNTVNSSQQTMVPGSSKASTGPNSINMAIQKTIQAANDKNTQILSRVDTCKKQVSKMRDDLNDILIKNIQLQQKTSGFSEKAQEQQTRITRLEMKLRARTQQLNQLQSNSQVFLCKVKKGQTSFIMSFQNYKKQCELRINTLLKRDQVAIKQMAKLKESIGNLQDEGKQKTKKISQLRDSLSKKSERLKIIEPQFNEINNERKDLKLQVQKMRNLQKDLAARESQIKLAEKNYYKSISSSTLDELRKFDQRQAMILQQLSLGKQNNGCVSELKQQNKSSNFFTKSIKAEQNQQSINNKQLKERQELMQDIKEFQKRKNKHNQTVRKFQWEKRDLLNQKSLLLEKQKRWHAQALNNKTSKWANMIFGIILGVILMTIINCLK